jgi:hypothetical protein
MGATSSRERLWRKDEPDEEPHCARQRRARDARAGDCYLSPKSPSYRREPLPRQALRRPTGAPRGAEGAVPYPVERSCRTPSSSSRPCFALTGALRLGTQKTARPGQRARTNPRAETPSNAAATQNSDGASALFESGAGTRGPGDDSPGSAPPVVTVAKGAGGCYGPLTKARAVAGRNSRSTAQCPSLESRMGSAHVVDRSPRRPEGSLRRHEGHGETSDQQVTSHGKGTRRVRASSLWPHRLPKHYPP